MTAEEAAAVALALTALGLAGRDTSVDHVAVDLHGRPANRKPHVAVDLYGRPGNRVTDVAVDLYGRPSRPARRPSWRDVARREALMIDGLV